MKSNHSQQGQQLQQQTMLDILHYSQDEAVKGSAIQDLPKVMRRHKWIIFICLASALVAVIIVNTLLTPLYEASVSIIYEEPTDIMNSEQSFYTSSGLANLTSQLQSRTLAEAVTKTLPDSIIRTFDLPNPLPPNQTRNKAIVQHLQNSISVENIRGSDVLIIKVQASDPVAAKVIANNYVERLKHWNYQRKSTELSDTRHFIEEQLASFQKSLRRNENALKDIKEKNKKVSLTDATSEIVRSLTDAEINYKRAKAERLTLEQRHNSIIHKIQQLSPSGSFIRSQVAGQLKQQLHDLETLYTRARTEGSATSAQILYKLKVRIRQVKNSLVEELVKTGLKDNLLDPLSENRRLFRESITVEEQLATYEAKEERLRRIITDYEMELQTLPEQELKLARLKRIKDVNEKIYSMFLEKREEVRIAEAGKVLEIKVIDSAEEPVSPIKPDKRKNLALALFGGLGLGIGLSIVRESFDNTIKTQEDVEKVLNLPVIASIPSIKSNDSNGVTHRQKNGRRRSRPLSNKLFCNLNRLSPVVEAYRSVRINFPTITTTIDSRNKAARTILVTSPGMSEGKTLTALNMAQVFAMTGVKTLLIDCDLRRPTIHKIIGICNEPGLTNLFTGKNNGAVNSVSLESTIRKFECDYLNILPCGTIHPNSSDFFMYYKIQNLLNKISTEFDLIILDAPPVISLTDARILAAQVNDVCMVVRSGKTNKDAALKAKELLNNATLGTVYTIVNDIDLQSTYSYSKYFYYQSRY